MKLYKKVPANQLWRKMLTMLFETGHPWITFKDPCNLRSPQQHVGVVHSSNLCTEITLNTGPDEIAVCNLGSVNMPAHLDASTGRMDMEKARRAGGTFKHRPVGLGIMGFQDCLHLLRIPYGSQAAVEFADRSMEAIAYSAYRASTDLAEERGPYSPFKGSLWDRGVLPIDTLKTLADERGGYVECDLSTTLDWEGLKKRIQQIGMRNSNCLANAPTATVAQ